MVAAQEARLRNAATADEAAGFDVAGARFDLGGRTLLAPLTLRFAPGRFHGLIGHNGSGKSTFLKLLARQELPTGGEICFRGVPLAGWGARAFARAVAYLPQATAPATGLTVRDLVSFGRYPWHGPFKSLGVDDLARIEEAMRLTDVSAFANRLVDTLSGGERQRAWIAMLVAQDSAFLLLDEPTSALDLAQQVEVLGLLHSLSRTRGVGIVAVLHDINMAARFCDCLVSLRAGTLQHCGTPAEIMQAPVLEAIYGLPMTVLSPPGTSHRIGLPR